MDFEIIDFHTHPFLAEKENICSHKDNYHITAESTVTYMKNLGVSKICGSVVRGKKGEETYWDAISACNESALKLWEMYGDFYVPGFHVHPDYVKESCEEIEKMHSLGVKLVGELVPYYHGWKDYSLKSFYEILDVAKSYNMIVNFHSTGEDEMDKMVAENPDVIFVAAHPGEKPQFDRHMERMKMSKNYYLDLSGTGLFRLGMLRHAIDLFGAERFLYGSDFPTCNPAMYVGGVLFDSFITDKEKEMIFSKNAKRLLNIK